MTSRRLLPRLQLLEEIAPFVLNGQTIRDAPARAGRIYALSSGMMTPKTLSNIFARRVLEDPQHSIFFVGYADPASPAGILKAAKPGDLVQLDPDEPPQQLRCNIEQFQFSAHASRESIVDYVKKLAPKKIVLVHGDPPAVEWTAATARGGVAGVRSDCADAGVEMELMAVADATATNEVKDRFLEHQFAAQTQDRLLDWLAATQPDVVCLQETKCTDEQFPELALRAAGYHSAFHGQKSYNGVAILSKTEPRDVRASLVRRSGGSAGARHRGDDRRRARLSPSTRRTDRRSVRRPTITRLKWYARLRKCLERDEHGAQDLAVCGDFNVAPKDEDVYDPDLWRGAIMCSDGERAAFRAIVRCGFDRHAALASSRGRVFSAGGIIACSRFRRIADCASMRFSRANRSRSIARMPESIARCARERNRPITRRSGRSLSVVGETFNGHLRRGLRLQDRRFSSWTLNVGRWTLDVNDWRTASRVWPHPPPKPLMIFDGDCHFCRRWIERWREMTARRGRLRIRIRTAAERFPEIPRSEFREGGSIHRN